MRSVLVPGHLHSCIQVSAAPKFLEPYHVPVVCLGTSPAALAAVSKGADCRRQHLGAGEKKF